MNLRDRLRRLRPAAPAGAGPLQPDEQETTSLPRDVPREREHLSATYEEARVKSTPDGEALYFEHTYPLHDKHGDVAIGTMLEVPSSAWAHWSIQPNRVKEHLTAHSALIIDLETTGLTRGAGTYAFLIGIGRFTEDAFIVRQYFMRDFPDEPAMVAAVIDELKGAQSVFTFNGKAFDWPLLQTRAILNRMRLPNPFQFDLLHPARRLWGHSLDNCKLSSIEEAVLGVTRHGDVPGSIIPSLFFDFVQTGDLSPLMAVMEHNRLDILSTAVVAGYVGMAGADPLHAAPAGQPLSGPELYAVGRLFEMKPTYKDLQKSLRFLEAALQSNLPWKLKIECQKYLTVLYKRAKRYDDATKVCQDMIAEKAPGIFAHVELAKHYEHRMHDFTRARDYTLSAIKKIQGEQSIQRLVKGSSSEKIAHRVGVDENTGSDDEMSHLMHRLQRLERRIASRATSALPPSARSKQA